VTVTVNNSLVSKKPAFTFTCWRQTQQTTTDRLCDCLQAPTV